MNALGRCSFNAAKMWTNAVSDSAKYKFVPEAKGIEPENI